MSMRSKIAIALSALSVLTAVSRAAADADQRLAGDFWAWRARTAQYTADDVTRMERPAGVARDWSRQAVAGQLRELAGFEQRWRQQDEPGASIPRQVDHRLIGSALARVRWELDILERWQRDPNFYLEQTLTPVGEALTVPGPYDEGRSREILARLDAIPAILKQAKVNLSAPPASYAGLAIDSLAHIRQQLAGLAPALAPVTTIPVSQWRASIERATASLEQYRQWLQQRLPTLPAQSAIGREKYVWFLQNVALMPYAPEELVAQAQQEWRRAVALEGLEVNRNRTVPPLAMATSTEEFIARHQKAELAVREFLAHRDILTLAPGLQHFTLRPIPVYLAPFSGFEELDDFTSPARLDQNGIRYVAPPSAAGSYFWVADARDPRIQIVHEGTVGHYGQLCASWQNPDPVRRHYYDSGANEGIGFYAEEMMLQSGLYDDSPHSREIVYNQMRLRAVRVLVDVDLALGTFTPAQAAEFLQHNVPMSAEDARAEVAEAGETPGQKIAYQIGKLQIIRMMADARLQQGERFSVRTFHDYLWLNGNVPIALQRWEYLGLEDELGKLNPP